MKTYTPKASEITREWHVVDADGNVVEGNYIGTDETGLLDRGNGDRGIQIDVAGWSKLPARRPRPKQPANRRPSPKAEETATCPR